MATPKFDTVSMQLARMIGDPVASASTAGIVLTANERSDYVNKAVQKLFNDLWVTSQGNVGVFISIVPELYKMKTLTFTFAGAESKYTIASPNLDILKVHKAITEDDYFVTVLKEDAYPAVKSGVNLNYVYTALKPALIDLNGVLYLFPSNIAEAGDIDVNCLCVVQPVGGDGNPYTQGGSYDIQFDYAWLTKIAEIAFELYKIDSQETT